MPDGEPPSAWTPPAGKSEHMAPSLLCVAAAIGLQLALPERVTPGNRWLLPSLEAVLLVGLRVVGPIRVQEEHPRRRAIALTLTAVVSADNIYSLALLTHLLLHHRVSSGRSLIVAGMLIWLTNVLIFALWYWEVDRGGPGRRAAGHDLLPDLQFPQMTDPQFAPTGWRPMFIDYLYVSLTNAAAFSPTDTMPLTASAKSVMGLQSLVSLVTIGLVVSRAVNILT
jgi:uncharacterized membrane protein